MKIQRHQMLNTSFVNRQWFRALYLTGISVYLYAFMEWIFFVTKPSFMSSMGPVQKADALLVAGLLLVVPALILELAIILAASRFRSLLWGAAAIPAFVLAALSLILLDNFTYTVFKFGIVNSQGGWRGIYAILFIAVFAGLLKNIHERLEPRNLRHAGPEVYFFLFLVAASLIAFMSHMGNLDLQALSSRAGGDQAAGRPDIILLGIDGVDATHMSVYGYQRQTTPNIQRLEDGALVAENAFSNSGTTGGSLTAVLTGRLPTETRVVYPPDILLGSDSYRHLPGLLKQLGYTTIQVTVPDFGDAYSRNIQDGFDIANFRSQRSNGFLDQVNRIGGGGGFYLVSQITQRIRERLEHVFYLRMMDNPYRFVTQPVSEFSEQKRFEAVVSYIKKAERPLFLHIHMMGTHGPKFIPRQNVFSSGETQDATWMTDFYDDAILDADKYIGQLFALLRKRDRLNDTILILYSDHGMNWNAHERVPLVFWFPGGEHAGRISENAQLIDIAPTLLDYLGAPQPEWMHGQSLLQVDLAPARRIFSAEPATDLVVHGEAGWLVDQSRVSPPFFQLGALNMVVCNYWFSLNLRTPGLSYGPVAGSTADCDPTSVPSPLAAQGIILDQLKTDGYDIADFPKDLPVTSVSP